MDTKNLFKLYGDAKESPERNNFESLWQDATEWCNPKADSVQKKHVAGERKSERRLIDVGIKARRMFTAGMMSHMFPSGQNWLRIVTEDREVMNNDNAARALNSATAKFIEDINTSNFYLEMGQSVGNFGDIGNACIYTELYEGSLNFRSHYIDSFYVRQNYREEIDTVFRSFTLTARQAKQQFGDEAPERVKQCDDKKGGTEFSFVHIVMPRSDYEKGTVNKEKKPIASYYICEQDKEWVKESGFDEMPYAVGRFYKTNYEIYGRSPAIEVSRTLPMINSMELTRIRSAERVSSPPWLAPNDGSVRRISNDQGSIIYWNPNNPNSKPEQLIAQDNPMVNDEMIQRKEQEILDAFYVPLFNPLHDKQNMTAFESGQRIDLSLQFLNPAVNRIEREFVKPVLQRAFMLLLRSGRFEELQIPELSEADIDFELVGKASLATKQIEMFGSMNALEQIGMVGQVKPEVWDLINQDEFARLALEVGMAPNRISNSKEDVEQVRQARAQQMAAQQQAQMTAMAAEAASKGNKKPEEGSPTAEIMEQMA